MTHSPPIPAGNVSPYPRQEPPHVHASSPPTSAKADDDDRDGGSETTTLLGVGAAVVLGVGATVAAFWFARRKPKPAPAKRGKRPAAKRTAKPKA